MRAVVDTIQQCNLRCLYCHPGQVWKKGHLGATTIRDVLGAAEEFGLLEVVLSGGEITMHPEISALLEATHVLRQTGSTLITNATLVTDDLVNQLARSNITRICTSVDGPDSQTHNLARGRTFDRVMEGLYKLQEAGKPITVISVAHQGNYGSLIELSYLLAERKLASQHHLCAPSYSGTARQHYAKLKLGLEGYFSLQQRLDEAHRDLKSKGMFVTFNSFWPATGHRSLVVDGGRTITLQQMSEQVKDSLVHVRPDGNFRITAASWGRETVGNAVIGNVLRDEPEILFRKADSVYGDGTARQLPREVEALHKFQIGLGANTTFTDTLIDSCDEPGEVAPLIAIKPLSDLSLLTNPLDPASLSALAAAAAASPSGFRYVQHVTGVYIIFDRVQSHVTFLTEAEWEQFSASYESAIVAGAARV